MASIGLSLPNLVSWSMQDSDNMSNELMAPYKSSLRLTAEQLSAILFQYGEEWIMQNYAINSDDPLLFNVIALTPNAYLTAGQVLCAGPETAVAMNEELRGKTPPPAAGGKPIAVSIGLSALSIAFPVAGFAATIVVDLYVNMLAKINTCNKEKDAVSFSPLDHKTYQFAQHGQCHEAETTCSAKMFGKCVQHKTRRCCYDMILTKIFAEGLKAQTGKGWESCNDLTIEDLKNISYRECKEGEDAQEDKCFPTEEFSEFKQALFRQSTKNMQDSINTKDLVDQVTNSMVIPK